MSTSTAAAWEYKTARDEALLKKKQIQVQAELDSKVKFARSELLRLHAQKEHNENLLKAEINRLKTDHRKASEARERLYVISLYNSVYISIFLSLQMFESSPFISLSHTDRPASIHIHTHHTHTYTHTHI